MVCLVNNKEYLATICLYACLLHLSVPKPAHLFFLCPYNKHLAIHTAIFHVLLDVKLPKVRKPSVLLVLDKVERGMGMGLFSI